MTPEQAGTLRAVLEALVQGCHERDESPKSNLAARSYSTALCRAELYLSKLALAEIQGPMEYGQTIPTADPVGLFTGDTVDLTEYDDTNVIPLIVGLRH